ncbi:MAG: metal-dependent hydrolase [Nanoarchaeota archaeon]|nr:metal-dependent hydrolase [Nanoarchaeota archaeon]
MLLRTHLAFAFLVYFLLLWLNFLDEKILFLSFLIAATILVDIDSKKSFIGKLFIFRPLQLFFSHRGVFHTLLAAVVFSFFIYLYSKTAAFAFFLGYILHLILDCMTYFGVKIFWPLFNWKIAFGMKTGGLIEEILFVLVLLMDFFMLIKVILY